MKEDKLLHYGVTALQVALLLVLVVLEIMSGYKAGLAQHLYYKKIYYVSQYYQGAPLFLHGLMLLALTVFALKGCKRYAGKIFPSFYRYLILLVAFVIFFMLPVTRELNIYTHGLMVLQLSMVLEVARLMLSKVK
ncbi:hypothetical protein [Desulfosediminicola ganghwensis]|uniref:hypothetical protein n=1 Tax=Desulfosediminicola ganghwensis TaxID=2569540 RepID=UPI0010ACFC01|nr:hypothetical protein [Desulfosediminicola ganghwensis]